MIIIESFARKTPVIVRDLGALPEVVNDSAGGFVYRTDEELLAAMRKLAASPRCVQNWVKTATALSCGGGPKKLISSSTSIS